LTTRGEKKGRKNGLGQHGFHRFPFTRENDNPLAKKKKKRKRGKRRRGGGYSQKDHRF